MNFAISSLNFCCGDKGDNNDDRNSCLFTASMMLPVILELLFVVNSGGDLPLGTSARGREVPGLRRRFFIYQND